MAAAVSPAAVAGGLQVLYGVLMHLPWACKLFLLRGLETYSACRSQVWSMHAGSLCGLVMYHAVASMQCLRVWLRVPQAGKLVGSIAKLCGGGGGGRPNLAQAGGRQPERIPEALEAAKKAVVDALQAL